MKFSRIAGAAIAAATLTGTVATAPAGAHAAPHAAQRTHHVAQRLVDGGPARKRVAGVHRPAGALPYDPAQVEAAKAAPQSAGAGSTATTASTATATTARVWEGTHDDNVNPASLSSAVGPTRYVVLDNSQDTIYDRTHNTYLSWDTLFQLTGDLFADSITDAQVIWDPTTKRFYYSALDTPGNGEYWINVGWSTTASPTTTDDWCKYSYRDYGTLYPDQPKLGDTKDFFVVGANVYDANNAFVSADALAFAKPAPGTACPDSVSTWQQRGLTTAAGLPAFAPVPANAVDTSSTGYLLARSGPLPSSSVSVFKINKAPDGSAAISARGSDVTVPTWTVAPNAPQAGSKKRIDTGDGRLTQAVLAYDPARGVTAVWTQHTVAGGAGSKVRWYEINPATHALVQTGSISSSTTWYYDAAISPDRHVDGTTSAYGSSAVILANSSSATARIGLVRVTKEGSNAQSAPVQVAISPGPHVANDCSSLTDATYCRWGDYASASPDPASPLGASSGRVWSSSQLSSGSPIEVTANWTSWNAVTVA